MNSRRLAFFGVIGALAASLFAACAETAGESVETVDASVRPIDDEGGAPLGDGAASDANEVDATASITDGGVDASFVDAATGTDASVADASDAAVDAGTSVDAGTDAGDAGHAPMVLTSTRFTSGGTYPVGNICGAGFTNAAGWHDSPPLAWTTGPQGTQSYAVIIVDVNNGNALHWAIYDLATSVTSLTANVGVGASITMPVVAKQGDNAFSGGTPARAFGYFGPCPQPFGSTHSYSVKVYALDVAALPTTPANPAQVVADLEAHKLETATLLFNATSPP